MLDTLLSTLAPHLCRSCGSIGAVLCDSCKYNIVYDSFNICLICGNGSNVHGTCVACTPNYSRAWCVGERTDELRRLIDDYKFENVKAAASALAELLATRIGTLPSSVSIVPVPTIASHVRQRGYDHAFLMAKKLAQLQGVKLQPVLKRATNAQQRGASKQQRRAQAKEAFAVSATLNGGIYLLVDDIATTGATLNYGAKALLEAGADEIWVAAVARQPG